jgi:DNA polymerase-1
VSETDSPRRGIGFDIESHLIKPGGPTPKGVCITFAERINGAIVTKIFLWETGMDEIERLLADPAVVLVAHNHVFDWGCILAARSSLLAPVFQAFEGERVWDTLIAQKLIDIAQGNLKYRVDPETGEFIKSGYSLAALMLRHFGEKLEKVDTWRLKYALLDGVPLEQWPQEAVDYAISDAVSALRVYEKQQEIAGGPIPTLGVQLRAYLALHLSSVWGLRTDPVATAKLKAELLAKVEAARAKLAGTGIYKKSKKGQISKFMAEIKRRVEEGFARQGKDVPLTEKGATGTSKEVLIDSKDPELAVLAEVMETDKLLTAFIPVLERGSRVPICTTYDLVESSRTSSRGPNIQQWPRAGGVRECIVAMAGYVLCSTDYSGLELCTLAQVLLELFGWSVMADQLKAGRDIHLYFGGQLIGLDYEDAQRRLKAGEKDIKEARQFAKCLNFGGAGGLGARTFVEYAKGFGLDITPERSAELIHLWKQTFPEMQEYFRYISNLTDCENPVLVHPRTGFVRAGVSYTAACNSLFQERAAFGGKRALWNLAKEEYLEPASPLYGSRTVAWIHDESIVAIPYDPTRPEKAHAAAYRQAEIMVESMKEVIPDVPIKADPTMFFRWYKNADPVFVNSVLVPSKPLEVDGKTKWVADLDVAA